MESYGLGKKRSKLGRFIDRRGITQEELRKAAGIDKETASRICSGDSVAVRSITKNRIVGTLRRLTGEDVNVADLW